MNAQYSIEHINKIEECKNFGDAVNISLDALSMMPQPIVQVCGPITTGGKGSVKENIHVMKKVIQRLEKQGISVFNQTQFEKKFAKLREESGLSDEESNKLVLEKFYNEIFKRNLIKRFYFIPGWKTSKGANWERERAKKLGIEIVDLPEEF
jgi:hypothetical protein